MATYLELFTLWKDGDLMRKVTVACADYADQILDEASPTQPRKDWATAARDDPEAAMKELMLPVLIANKANTVSQVQNAADAAILTNVGDEVDKRYGAA